MASAQYTQIFEEVAGLTKKPLLLTETNIGIRNAIQKAHRAGQFWRDLVTVQIPDVLVEQVQSIDTSVPPFVRFKQIGSVKNPGRAQPLEVIDALNLTDYDGFFRVDCCYMIGRTLNIRSASPADNYSIIYYQMPDLLDITEVNDWVPELHQDYVVNAAAAYVLTLIGEQEIKQEVTQQAAMMLRDLVQDNLEAQGR